MKKQRPEETGDVMSLQEGLWDRIHDGQQWRDLNFIPNSLAVEVQKMLPSSSHILEIGCSRGRDARYFASHGHSVVGVDFSQVGLSQMMSLAKQQGCDSRITPIHHNIAGGFPLPPPNLRCIDEGLPPFDIGPSIGPFDCFYSRSSLHIDDNAMIKLFSDITPLIKDGGLIAIEGRTDEDDPIQESERVGKGLAVNWRELGHVRRIWTEEFCLRLAEVFSWIPVTLVEHEEDIGNKKKLLRFIAKKSS